MDTDYQLVSFGCRLLFNIFSNRPSVRGRENIEALDPPYIVACNHASNIDPALMLGYYPEPVRFLAKAELARLPWIGFIERRLGNIHLERDGRDVGPIRQALTELKSGSRCLVVFLGGRRTGGDGLEDAKHGAAMLAARSRVPVIPVYLENTAKVAPPGTLVPAYYPVRMHIGSPVDLGFLPKRASDDELETATEAIRAAILEMKRDRVGAAA